MWVRDASVMRDRSRQRSCRVTRTKRHVHAIVGVRALSNVRPEATSTDVCARCERDARSQSSACMPRDAKGAGGTCHGRREDVVQRTL